MLHQIMLNFLEETPESDIQAVLNRVNKMPPLLQP